MSDWDEQEQQDAAEGPWVVRGLLIGCTIGVVCWVVGFAAVGWLLLRG